MPTTDEMLQDIQNEDAMERKLLSAEDLWEEMQAILNRNGKLVDGAHTAYAILRVAESIDRLAAAAERCPNAKFCLSDSVKCEELGLLIKTQSKQIRELKHGLAESQKAMSGYIASQARER